MEPILRVQNLTKTFTRSGQSNLTAVNGISFDLLPGECLGIIGESGSGKTTAVNLRMIYRKMQMVFQTPTDSFDPRRTLGDGIGESLRNCGMSRHDADAQAERLLERCGLPAAFAGRYPHEVSGGQCQRAAIARALAVKPKVLICDEATSALDVTVQKEILELLHTLRSEQGTKLSILFICHDISLVQQFCDRVLVMYHGDIVEQGAPDAVIYHPQNDYTKELLAASPEL